MITVMIPYSMSVRNSYALHDAARLIEEAVAHLEMVDPACDPTSYARLASYTLLNIASELRAHPSFDAPDPFGARDETKE